MIAEHGVPAVIMHSPVDNPRTMQHHAVYTDVVAEVGAFLAEQVRVARADGVEQIVIDPGIGFGKTAAHNLDLLRNLGDIVALGSPVLVGASRKRFIGDITHTPNPADRLAGSLTAHLTAVANGAHIVRVHDVREHVQALRMAAALRG